MFIRYGPIGLNHRYAKYAISIKDTITMKRFGVLDLKVVARGILSIGANEKLGARLLIVGLSLAVGGLNLAQIISDRQFSQIDVHKTLNIIVVQTIVIVIGIASVWLFKSKAILIMLLTMALELAIVFSAVFFRNIPSDRILAITGGALGIILMGTLPLTRTE